MYLHSTSVDDKTETNGGYISKHNHRLNRSISQLKEQNPHLNRIL
jgi:hypothetical protein